DGDQMAVHLPLSKEAQAEAYEIMMSNHNLLKPASAEPITVPRQDMVLGLYYMTSVNEKKKGAGSIFGSQEEAKIANNLGHVHQLAPIKVRMDGQLIETTVGRLKFNDILPLELRFLNETVSKKVIKRLFMEIIEKCGRERLVKFTDDAKYLGFENATVSGLSMGIIGINPPAKKAKVLEQANEQVEQLNKHYRYGLLTEEERYENTLKVWGKAKAEIAEATKSAIPKDNSIYLMIDSGSRGNWDNITHLLGMKGSVASPTGKIIELPIRSSILEGFSIIEYFIGCHAGRKGMADRSLRTAQAGYLTRKLVDSVQDVLIREDDCGTEKSINISKADSTKMKMNYAERLFSRRAAEDIADENGEVLVPKGEIINREMARKIDALGIGEARIFAPTTCQTKNGVCKKCYGLDLATASEVNCGTPVGIMAAQSIGEPGTQLTMNTFHLHGAAESADITAGLPRVEELFEARSPKVEAFMSPVAGIVSIKPREYGLLIILRPNEAIEDKYDLHRETRVLVKTNDKVTAKQIIGKTELGENKFTIKAKAAGKVVEITPEYITIRRPEDEVFEYKIGSRVKILVKDGDKIAAGTQLTAGHLDLRKLLAATDIQSVQNYIVSETQKVYASQGVSIHDKHFEIVTNQMLSRVRITDGGDTDYLPGEVISRRQIEIENAELERQNKKKASYEQLILGIARVALNTDSWLSAAAFQETVKVLIEAASASDVDDLDGVKENVIIGRLIPAGKNFKPKTPCHNVEAKLV
ncbi:MAG: DNA-directed RNA polymerase subunit beta', partial [Patescibacteria group bacterium]|nr:DNA-directed RNA polymerase subunit beta' [Patescibacteria group bacterium]